MSVKLRPYGKAGWQVDIRFRFPDETIVRERLKSPVTGRNASQRWGEERERFLVKQGPRPSDPTEEVPPAPRLEEFSQRFLEDYARANQQKPSGVEAKRSILRVHILPALGPKPLDRITTEDIQRLKGRLGKKAPKTVNNVLTVLNVLLKTAVQWGAIREMPCTIRLLKVPRGTATFHDFESFERLVDGAKGIGGQALVVVLLGGEAGLRCGEMIALEWKDVDLGRRQLCVRRSDWNGQITAPKGNRIRYVPLTTRLEAALREHRHLRSPRVLCRADGSPVSRQVVQYCVKLAARQADVPDGVHVLRHTFCSHLAMQGAPLRAIQELAGHREITMTQRYMHVSPAAIDGAIRLLDRPVSSVARGEIVATAEA
jgi:integrase